jgi:hypothetical protein
MLLVLTRYNGDCCRDMKKLLAVIALMGVIAGVALTGCKKDDTSASPSATPATPPMTNMPATNAP